MNEVSPNRTCKALVLVTALLLAACGTPAAKDFGGRWKPVNRFQPATTEIPLNRPYTYYASPMDGTLKTMLTRWTTDTGMTLVYRLPSDYTLFAPVAKVRTADIRQAASELSSIYAPQGVSIGVDGGRLVVHRPTTPGSGIAPAGHEGQQPAANDRPTTNTTSPTAVAGSH